MENKISQKAPGNLVVSLRLWIRVDFRSSLVYAKPVQVKSPCLWITQS